MIELTQKAVNQVKKLISDGTAAPGSSLRVKVLGGGCSGMSYKLDFDTNSPTENDKVFELDGVKVLVDSKSYLFLKGTILDFSDGLNGRGFVFENPNAKKSCGCGSSFAV